MTASASTTPASDARPTALPERFAWGRMAARGTALTYLIVLLIIPLAVILQDGLQGGLGSLCTPSAARYRCTRCG